MLDTSYSQVCAISLLQNVQSSNASGYFRFINHGWSYALWLLPLLLGLIPICGTQLYKEYSTRFLCNCDCSKEVVTSSPDRFKNLA